MKIAKAVNALERTQPGSERKTLQRLNSSENFENLSHPTDFGEFFRKKQNWFVKCISTTISIQIGPRNQLVSVGVWYAAVLLMCDVVDC